MNVLYTCDNNYVWIMGISMMSLFDNNRDIKDICVYLLGENISNDNKEILRNIVESYHRTCVIIDTPELDIPDMLCSQRWPKSAFSRLYAGDLLPNNVKEILYLDCDTVISGSLAELDNFDYSDYAIYGVKDCISKQYRRNIGIDDSACYINAGVLLMNLEKLRNFNISQMIEEFLNKYAKRMHYADQDVLNGMFKGNFGILKPEFDVMTLVCTYQYKDIMKLRKPSNYYSESEIAQSVNKPTIIHYTTCMLSVRPWFVASNHPYADVFLKYKEISPWKSKSLFPFKNNNTKNKVLSLVFKMPSAISLWIIGILHSKLFPCYICLKSKR